MPDAGATPVSDDGAFFFTLNDALNPDPQYPGGSCTVSYAPPPGFPSGLQVNDGGTGWVGGFGAKNDTVSWEDSQVTLPGGFSLAGDFVTINDASGSVLYSSNTAVPSPLTLPSNTVSSLACPYGTSSKCTLRVTSLYQDARREHSTAYEGGMTVLSFQRGGPTPGG